MAAELTDSLFRRSAGRLVSVLTRALGPEHLSVAEDAVQDALLKALQTWPYQGIPDNPEGWLYRVALRRALDAMRRATRLASRAAKPTLVDTPDPDRLATFADDQLTMTFLCCHPVLSEPLRVGLTLKVVAGFGVDEIAAAFLAPRSAIQQRLVRAKRILRAHAVSFAMPADEDLPERLGAVLAVLYLTFNEGYSASAGDLPVRAELCAEAIRLAQGLVEHRVTDRPEVHALLALMHFQASRLPARTDAAGGLVLLEDQDRGRWNQQAIARGFAHLERAAHGTALTAYHLEAGIASCHAAARDVAATDWRRILEYYDQWVALDGSPLVRLNRAVALARVHGPAAGLAALEGLERDRRLERYHLLPAVRAYLLAQTGRDAEARAQYARAAALARTAPEADLLRRRLTAAPA